MAEAESQHRRNQENYEAETDRLLVQGDIASERRGMWLAFVITVLMVGTGAFLVYQGSLAWGVGLISADLLALVGLFIYGRGRSGSTASPQQHDNAQQKLPFPN